MRRLLVVMMILALAVSSAFSVSLRELFPNMDDEKYEALLSGEVIDDSTVNGDIRYMVPEGALITESAEEVFSYEKGFAVAVSVLRPYPESFKGLSNEEMLLRLYNNGEEMSTLEGITYISHRAGDKYWAPPTSMIGLRIRRQNLFLNTTKYTYISRTPPLERMSTRWRSGPGTTACRWRCVTLTN